MLPLCYFFLLTFFHCSSMESFPQDTSPSQIAPAWSHGHGSLRTCMNLHESDPVAYRSLFRIDSTSMDLTQGCSCSQKTCSSVCSSPQAVILANNLFLYGFFTGCRFLLSTSTCHSTVLHVLQVYGLLYRDLPHGLQGTSPLASAVLAALFLNCRAFCLTFPLFSPSCCHCAVPLVESTFPEAHAELLMALLWPDVGPF